MRNKGVSTYSQLTACLASNDKVRFLSLIKEDPKRLVSAQGGYNSILYALARSKKLHWVGSYIVKNPWLLGLKNDQGDTLRAIAQSNCPITLCRLDERIAARAAKMARRLRPLLGQSSVNLTPGQEKALNYFLTINGTTFTHQPDLA